MAARCFLLVWVKSAKGIPQPRANVFQERGRCWGILPSGGAVLGIVPGHGGHRHRQDLRQPVLDGGDDLEGMKSGLSSQKGITMFRQNRTIPALRLKHRSGSCGTASALPKCSIMSGCGTGQNTLTLEVSSFCYFCAKHRDFPPGNFCTLCRILQVRVPIATLETVQKQCRNRALTLG